MTFIFITLLLSPPLTSNRVGREGEDALTNATASVEYTDLNCDLA
jgi:hypothetical protein